MSTYYDSTLAAYGGWPTDRFDDGQAAADAINREYEALRNHVLQHSNTLDRIASTLESSLGPATVGTLSSAISGSVASGPTSGPPGLLASAGGCGPVAPLGTTSTPPKEAISYSRLIRTNDKNLDNVLIVLSGLCIEVEHLREEAETRFFPALATYGEHVAYAADLANAAAPAAPNGGGPAPPLNPEQLGEAQLRLGRFLPLLQEACTYVNRLYDIIVNFVQQLGALYAPKSVRAALVAQLRLETVPFQPVFDSLMEALAILLTLDAIAATNTQLQADWRSYRQMIMFVMQGAERFGRTESQLAQVDGMLQEIEARLLAGSVFSGLFSCRFDFHDSRAAATAVAATSTSWFSFGSSSSSTAEPVLTAAPGGLPPVRLNTGLRDELLAAVRAQVAFLQARIGQPVEVGPRTGLIGLAGLLRLASSVVDGFAVAITGDKQLIRAVWDLGATSPLVPLMGNAVFDYLGFLAGKAFKSDARASANFARYIRQGDLKTVPADRLKRLVSTGPATAATLSVRVAAWSARMGSELILEAGPAGSGSGTRAARAGDSAEAQLQKDALIVRNQILIQGLVLGHAIDHLARELLHLHLHTGRQLASATARTILRLVELAKAVEGTFARHQVYVARLLPSLHFVLSSSLVDFAASFTRRFSQDPRMRTQLEALGLLVRLVSGPPTTDRLKAAGVALAMIRPHLRDHEYDSVVQHLRQLSLLGGLSNAVVVATRCEFIYWNRTLLSTYMRWLWSTDGTPGAGSDGTPAESWAPSPEGLPLFLAAAGDVAELLRAAGPDGLDALRQYSADIYELLETEVITPACTAIDDDLRISGHHDLRLSSRNPFKPDAMPAGSFLGLADYGLTPLATAGTAGAPGSGITGATGGAEVVMQALRRTRVCLGLCQMAPLMSVDGAASVDLRAFITQYLDNLYYHQTALAPHNWTRYERMKILARERYGLVLSDARLPPGTQEQMFDALEIMRNIHVFMSRYRYNMHQQFFIESSSSSKYLHTIHIRHVANSIRTHGSGMMNTAVNVTYQFLRREFRLFSEFLYDDHIKSRLVREARFVTEQREAALGGAPSGHSMALAGDFSGYKAGARPNRGGTPPSRAQFSYPFERAEELNRWSRSLGVRDKTGTQYLDEFRRVVTVMGNALGYVRLVRSGGLHHASRVVAHVPEITQMTGTFGEGVTRDGIGSTSSSGTSVSSAASNMDATLENLMETFSSSTDYFRNLVDAFAAGSRHPRNVHLKHFYLLVPALTLSHVEHMVASKDRLDKNRPDGAAFTDDGFALGVAYALKLLDLDSKFDALHWFSSVHNHYEQAARRIDQAAASGSLGSGGDANLGSLGGVGASDLLVSSSTLGGGGRLNSQDQRQSTILAKKKLDLYRKEFHLLYVTLTGARILFREEGEHFSPATAESSGGADAAAGDAATGDAAAPAAAE
ncbi:hypothetical protein H696_01503 [Fonticula alba]|uniref:Uncharacterized protein n=1 Tax=Fonticula alba TaxID=691883 RepID=A0A058ZDR1_FONAL|nr:hypothetical protein H696_01503 [Fonticula alba]KCV72096.1 hypothetical protein H696_01503 [Fonticula alba]|eukprot:XP_009493674.1 hypothetical protein H696_01503 [Fonticula alba]